MKNKKMKQFIRQRKNELAKYQEAWLRIITNLEKSYQLKLLK
jgi:hypothetical protein